MQLRNLLTISVTFALFTTFCAPSVEACGEDWPHWRGPHYNGSALASNLPTEFDKQKAVLWSAQLAGPGASTPIVAGGRVYLTSIEADAGELLALCLDASTGEVEWEDSAGSGYKPGGAGEATLLHRRSNYASPSAVTDGERVVFFFGNGDLVAYELDGERLWSRNLQKDLGDFTFQWTFSASPTITSGKLILPILQRDTKVHERGKEGNPSFVLGLDPASGETLYQVERPSDARVESLESYATAIPHEQDGRKEVLIVGGDIISGHDPASGKELWRWGTWNPGHREIWWRVVPSPVVAAGVALVCAPKGAPVYAVKLGGEGTLGEDALSWKSEGRRNPVTSDVATPLVMDDAFFVLFDRGKLSRVAASDGQVQWTIDMPGKALWRASPTGADGKIYCMNHAGLVVVVDPADGKLLHEVEMGEPDDDHTRSTIAVAQDRLYIRTNSRLFCVGNE